MEKPNTPPKPHFCQPLVDQNFRNELLIPSTFFTKYVDNGERYQKAMLKTSKGKKVWEVWMKEGTMVDGWRDFVEDNDLHKGDVLVFAYEGSLLFHVFIFDPTACERDYPHFDDDDDGICFVEEDEQSHLEAFETPKDEKDPEEIENRKNKKRKFEANATNLRNGNPCFVVTLKPSYVKRRIQVFPVDFSKQIGLNCEKCPTVIIKDQKQRLWNVKINQKKKGNNTILFGAGWHDFCVGNQLKEGDSFTFEVTKMGNRPTFIFHHNEDPNEIEKRDDKKRRTEANETSSSNENPYFVATLMPSYVRSKLMMIPTKFSKLYDLHTKIWREIIIRDQKQRIWNVEIKHKTGSNQFYFKTGWHDFCVGNSLKEGDSFKFELTDMGNRPTFNFHWIEGSSMTERGKCSKAEATSFKVSDRSCEAKKNIGCESKNWSYNIGDPYFHGIICQTHLTKYQMRLPRSFTESNGLSDANCNKMIKLRNMNGGTRQVLLRYKKFDQHIYLGSGWAAFALENKLQVGDKFKLELVTEENMLIVNYYGLEGSVMAKKKTGSKAKASNFKGLETSRKVKTKNTSYTTGETCFYGIISARHLSRNEMRFPREFARSNGLDDRKDNEIIKIRNINGASWQVVLGKQKWDNISYLGRGWIEFAMDNDLQVGDSFKLEVVKDTEDDMPIMKYYGSMTKREMLSRAEATALKTSETSFREKLKSTSNAKRVSYNRGESFFHGIVTKWHLVKKQMRFPREFARSNGLNARQYNEVIKLRNKNGESWQVILGRQKCDGQAYLGHGWIEFATDNDLQVGDPFKLEVVKNTEDDMLIMNCYGSSTAKREIVSEAEDTSLKASETSFKEKQKFTSKAKSVSYNRGESYFYGTITKWHLTDNQMRLPRDFARSNGLDKKCDEMIKLRNKNGKSWPVFLRKQETDGQVYIGRGLREFAIENKLQGGDKFKLEVVIEWDRLIMNYFGLGDTATIVAEMSSSERSTAMIKQEWTSNPKPAARDVMDLTSTAKPMSTTTGSSFCYVVEPYHLTPRGVLVIPRKFAVANDLNNKRCNVILKDQSGESWQVGLSYEASDGRVYLRQGWCDFARGNHLRLGDEFKIELVRDGTNLIFNHCRM